MFVLQKDDAYIAVLCRGIFKLTIVCNEKQNSSDDADTMPTNIVF
jgi:hypothetical protein